MENIAKKAVFLDRDGTLNEDPGYLREPSQLKLIPGVGEALELLRRSGFSLIVISNQSGVGRGLIDPAAIPKIHAKMSELLSPWAVDVDDYYLCFHRPEDLCECRKPKPKLLLDAARVHHIDVSLSYMVGDKPADIGAGKQAGCKAVALVRTGEGKATEAHLQKGEADFIGDSLLDVARWILKRENANS